MVTVCPITGSDDCRSRDCELHTMSAPLRLAGLWIIYFIVDGHIIHSATSSTHAGGLRAADRVCSYNPPTWCDYVLVAYERID